MAEFHERWVALSGGSDVRRRLICAPYSLARPPARPLARTIFPDTGASDDPSRVGQAENPLLDGVVDQLSTTISRMDGHTNMSALLNKVHADVSLRLYLTRQPAHSHSLTLAHIQAQGRVIGGVKGDRDLLQSFKEISVMAERVSLPKTVADQAKQLYKKVFDEDEARGKPNVGLVAACLFIACRQDKVGGGVEARSRQSHD